jgi:acyl-CoA thioester hydrolase
VPLELRVIYGDTDQMGVVYHGNYLRYFEAARGWFIRARGHSYRDMEASGYQLPVVEASVRYRRPLRYDDLFHVDVVIGERRPASVRFDYRIHLGDELCADGFTLHACVDARGKPVRWPPAMIAMLEAAPLV